MKQHVRVSLWHHGGAARAEALWNLADLDFAPPQGHAGKGLVSALRSAKRFAFGRPQYCQLVPRRVTKCQAVPTAPAAPRPLVAWRLGTWGGPQPTMPKPRGTKQVCSSLTAVGSKSR